MSLYNSAPGKLVHPRFGKSSLTSNAAGAAAQGLRMDSFARARHDADKDTVQPHMALGDALAAAIAARARAPDLAELRQAAVARRRGLQRQLTSLSMVLTSIIADLFL